MQLSAAEMNILAGQGCVLVQKLEEEQIRIQKTKKENVCGLGLGFSEDSSMVSLKSC